MSCGTKVTVKGGTQITLRGGGAKQITLSQQTVAKVNAARPKTRVVTNDTPVQVADRNPRVRAGGGMGMQGPKGDAAEPTITRNAAAAIGGHRVVHANDAGEFALSDAASLVRMPVGVTIGAAAAGAPLTAQTFGPLTHNGWAWDLDQYVFLASNGLLTQVPNDELAVLRIGYPIKADTLFIDIDQPIMPE